MCSSSSFDPHVYATPSKSRRRSVTDRTSGGPASSSSTDESELAEDDDELLLLLELDEAEPDRDRDLGGVWT